MRQKLLAQLVEIVDLAVENNDNRAVLIEDGLLAGFQINDRKALESEPDGRPDVRAVLVGSAMNYAPLHPGDKLRVHWPRRIAVHLSNYSAHFWCSVKQWGRGKSH